MENSAGAMMERQIDQWTAKTAPTSDAEAATATATAPAPATAPATAAMRAVATAARVALKEAFGEDRMRAFAHGMPEPVRAAHFDD